MELQLESHYTKENDITLALRNKKDAIHISIAHGITSHIALVVSLIILLHTYQPKEN